MAIIIPGQHRLLHRVRQGARWVGQDDYPAHPAVANEHERWLAFVDGKGELDRFFPRLQDRATKRDEALAEIAVGYFLEVHCSLPVAEWEPVGTNRKTGDCLVDLADRIRMFVEVKAPGWECEVVEAEGAHNQRLSKPKHIQAETRSTAPWEHVRAAVKKAYEKLPATRPTLVVIVDDLFVGLNEWPPNVVEVALYCPRASGCENGSYLAEDGSFVGPTYRRLGGVGILNVDFPCGASNARFRFTLCDNPRCLPTVAIPKTILSEYRRSRRPMRA